jgi:branched-chain amino acid transport system ATP-binding protein
VTLLEIEGVTVRFGGITAVNAATLSAEAGKVTGLIGANGAGKTTLFNVVTGMYSVQEGQVRLDGKDITKKPTHTRARLGIARTFQRLEAFGSLSVWENVLCAAEIHRRWRRGGTAPVEVARRLMSRVGLVPFAAAQADAVPTGVARLLEVARALAIEPTLLLLDEPSSGLSDEETAALGRLLRELAADGTGVLMVEHDMSLVMSVCDYLHVLNFGEVICSGEPEAVRRDPAVQRAYLGMGAGELAPAASG